MSSVVVSAVCSLCRLPTLHFPRWRSQLTGTGEGKRSLSWCHPQIICFLSIHYVHSCTFHHYSFFNLLQEILSWWLRFINTWMYTLSPVTCTRILPFNSVPCHAICNSRLKLFGPNVPSELSSNAFVRSISTVRGVIISIGPVIRSSLPAWLPWEPSDLSGLEPGSAAWDLAYIWVSLATASQQSSLPTWSSWEPSDLSGLKPDGPLWVAFGHSSLAQPSVCLSWEPLIWVDSIQIVPLDPHKKSQLSSTWDSFVGQSQHIYIYIYIHC